MLAVFLKISDGQNVEDNADEGAGERVTSAFFLLLLQNT